MTLPSATAALAVTDLSVTFPTEAGAVRAVRGLSFSLRAGSVLGIVGESGSGKSATAMAVMGLLPPSARVEGSVTFRGRSLLDLSDRDLSGVRGSGIAMVFQDPLSALTPVYSVGYQIAEALLVHQDIGREAAAGRAVELLDLVGIPEPGERSRAFPHEFSGGMRQRVMIAMAIANDPDVILADEPTTALDVTIQAQVLEVLRTAQRETGAAIVLITHDLGVVAGFAEEVIVMYAGRAVEQGPVDEVFAAPRMPYTLGLLGSIPRLDDTARTRLTPIEGSPPSMVALPSGCPFQPRCPMRVDICTQIEPGLVTVTGHSAACHRQDEIIERNLSPADVFPAPPPPALAEVDAPAMTGERPVVLSVTGLVRHYPLLKGSVFRRQVGVVRAVDGVDLQIREGETLGLVGESGCGKTTTIHEILSLVAPQDGRVAILGRETSGLERAERRQLRRDVSVVFQDPTASLDPRMPLGDILAEGLLTYGVDQATRRARVAELLRLVGLEPSFASRFPNEFSGGQRQRIGIARALALDPKLIVLDEPVSALDVSIRAGVINLLEDLKDRLGLAYLFVSHDLSVIRHLADRVSVMYLGRIVEAGDVDTVFTAPVHPYTQALLSAVPLPDPARERARRRIILEGDLPNPVNPPSGCRFRSRCFRYAAFDPVGEAERRARCETEDPAPTRLGTDHEAACHHPQVRSVV